MATYLYFLEPMYLACRPAGERISPLGTILVADLAGDVVSIVEAANRMATQPWCPIVLVRRSAHLSPTVEAVIEQFDMDPAIVTVTGDNNLLDPEPILLAVRRRLCPTPERLADYVTQRVGRRDLTDALRDCFRHCIDENVNGPGLSRSTLSRRLLDFAPFKARDWSAIARTLAVLLDSGRLGPASRLHGIDPRTVRARVKLVTGLDFGQARERPGWEWVIEAGLRRVGYVQEVVQPSDTGRISQSG